MGGVIKAMIVCAFALCIPVFSAAEFATLPGKWQIHDQNWRFEVAWTPDSNGGTLACMARPMAEAEALNLALAWPRLGRDDTRRIALDTETSWQWRFDLPSDGNPFNRYQLQWRLADRKGTNSTRTLIVAGINSAAVALGELRSAQEIAASPFGVCTHFSLGVKPEGAYGGWHDYRTLLDKTAEAGFKWIREECNIVRNEDGSFHVYERDLEWMKYAENSGISYILMIPMLEADQPLEEFLRKVEAVVRDTRQWVRVYELGNEPQHAGTWRQVHGGSWNGKEPDGSTSPWVAAHLRATNAAAERIKALYPEATVLGLGMAAPTNFRALELGLSEAVDGVVDHAYTYSLPPERIPFGLPFTERDGIAVGDAEFSFAALVESYHRQFAKTGKARELWITEFGFSSFVFTPDNAVSDTMLYAAYSEEAQAVYLARRFLESLTLPIQTICQYDLLDDMQSRPEEAEANFGLLRSDYSPKSAYFALGRVNALLAGAKPDLTATAVVNHAPLHRASQRHTLVAAWDQQPVTADNSMRCAPLCDPEFPDERLLTVWSAQPMTNEFSGRGVQLTIQGWLGFDRIVAIDLIDGRTYDVTWQGDSAAKQVTLLYGNHPLVLKFIR